MTDTTGDPITGLKWSRRTTDKISSLLADYGFTISPNTVARLLHAMDLDRFILRNLHGKRSHGEDKRDTIGEADRGG